MAPKRNYVTLARNGKPLFSIDALPKQDADSILEPVEELSRHLERSIGAPAPRYDDDQPVRIELTLDPRADLEREEFVMRTTPRGVALRARTLPAMFHAVYTFLDRVVGVRWLWPGEEGTVVPRRRTLRAPLGTAREKPDFASRRLGVGGPIYGPKGGQDYLTTMRSILGLPASYLHEFNLWCRRNRLGGLNLRDGHRWAEIAPPAIYAKRHPDLYALVDGRRDTDPRDGKHGAQPCLSNPAVVKVMADYVIARFDADPSLDGVSIGLNDGGGSCECPACLRIDRRCGAEEAHAIEHFDQLTAETKSRKPERSITDRLMWNANAVAARVARRYPDRKVLTLLYSTYRRPPVTMRLAPNVIGQYCVMGATLWHAGQRRTEYGRLRQMGRVVPSLGVYEYYANGAWPEIHRLFPELVEQTVRAYHRAGVRYFATQPGTGFAANGLNFYLLARLLWNRRASARAATEDFCRAGFGPAAAEVLRYLDAFSRRWKETESATNLPRTPQHAKFGMAHLYPDSFIAERTKELDAAARKAGADPQILARIAFLRRGLEYTAAWCRAARATQKVLEAAGVARLDEAQPNEAVRSCAAAALDAWETYWGFVRENMGRFVFGEFWAHYRPGPYGSRDGVLQRLRELAQAIPPPAVENVAPESTARGTPSSPRAQSRRAAPGRCARGSRAGMDSKRL